MLTYFFFLELSPYKEFLDEKRWDRLIEQFRHEYYRLFHMSNQSVFTVTLEAGLSALKTPYPLLNSFSNAVALYYVYTADPFIILIECVIWWM